MNKLEYSSIFGKYGKISGKHFYLFILVFMFFAGVSAQDEVISGEVNTSISSPASEIDVVNGITIEWNSLNNYNAERDLTSSYVELEGSNGRAFIEDLSRNEQISAGSSTSYTVSASESELSNLETGEWELSVEDTWAPVGSVPEEKSSETVTFTATNSSVEEDSDSVRIMEGEIDIELLQPKQGDSVNTGDGKEIEWNSLNNYNGSRVLGSSTIEIKGTEGRTMIKSLDLDKKVASESLVSNSVSVSEDDFNDLEGNELNLTVEDTWDVGNGVPEESISASVTFSIQGSGDENNNSSDDDSDVIVDDGSDDDDSTDDSDNTTDDSGGDNTTDDSTNDSTDDSTDDSSDDSTEDSSDSDDSSNDGSTDDGSNNDGEASNNCPDGFTYDSENDVCLEDSSSDSDSDNSDSSNDESNGDDSTDDQNSDEVTGGDDSNTSMLQQEVAAGISLQTMLLGLLALLTLGLLFKRSSYTLKF